VEQMAPNPSSAEMPLTLGNDLEGNTQDTNGISPVLPLSTCHKASSDFWFFSVWWISWLLWHRSVFTLRKHQIFHASLTELLVNKIARLRLIYLPF